MKIDPMIAAPLALLIAAAGWKTFAVDPVWRADRAALASAKALPMQTERLRLSCSEPEAAAWRGRAAQARGETPKEAEAVAAGERLVGEAAGLAGWRAEFGKAQTGGGLATWQVVLRPDERNHAAWRSLVALWEGLQARHPQIGLTRLSVRADEQGRYSAEATLRLPYLLPNEEISE